MITSIITVALAAMMPPPRKVGRQARSELESFLKEQPDNYLLIGYLALTNMGSGDKAAALALSERAMAALGDWSHSDRDPGPGSVADGRARPRHRRFTETTLDTVRWRFPCGPTYSCIAPARSHVRSASE